MANPGRGRPTDLAKREAIVDAARSQFLTKGFDATTMESVAGAAGVSKVTIFNHFGDKVSLLGAVVDREATRLERAGLDVEVDGDPTAQLAHCGEALLPLLLSPDIVAFDRLLGGEPYRGSDLVRAFFAAGPKRGQAIVVQLISRAAERGLIRIDDTEQAADDLVALWIGATWREEIALGLRRSPDEDQVRARVRHGLDIFLRIYGN